MFRTCGIFYNPKMPLKEHTPFDTWHLLHSKMPLKERKPGFFYIPKMPLTKNMLSTCGILGTFPVHVESWLHSKNATNTEHAQCMWHLLLHPKNATNTEQTLKDTRYLLCSKMPVTEHTPYDTWHLPHSKNASNTKHTPILHTHHTVKIKLSLCLISSTL
jgi:hypothetical protein